MTRKTKKLGVKVTKTAVFDDDENFEVKPDNEDIQDESASKDSKSDDVQDENASNDSNESKSDVEKDQELDKICSIIDKLTLDMFILMQQNVQQKLKIEKCMTAGELHLSKSRYIMGLKNVSSLQLPTETSDDIDPSTTVKEITDDAAYFGKPRLEIVTEAFSKKNEDDEKNIQDPVKWFGVLVPRDLRSAQNKFQDALENVVECANIQIRLHQTCVKIKQLKKLKEEIMKHNEE